MDYELMDDDYRKFETPEELLNNIYGRLGIFGKYKKYDTPYRIGDMMFKPEGGTRVVEQVLIKHITFDIEIVEIEIVSRLIKYVEEKLEQGTYEKYTFRNTGLYDLFISIRYSEKCMVYIRFVTDGSSLFAELITEQRSD